MKYSLLSILVLMVAILAQVTPLSGRDHLLAEGSDSFVTETSKHYSITYEGSAAEAQAYLAVLEGAWPAYKEFFKKEPKLNKNEKLKVYFAANKESMVKKLVADGAGEPDAGGYYWMPTKTAYLYQQPTIYYTRQLLIHECLHQFHFLATTNNQNLQAKWFVEGLAEYFPRHYWDGKRFEPRVAPLLSLEDLYAKALEQVSDPAFDLEKVIDGEVAGERPQWMAIIGWMFERASDKKHKNFYSMFDRLNAGNQPKGFTKKYLGDPKKVTAEMIAWLKTKQEPWTPIWNQWEAIAKDRVRGHAPSTVSACRTKANTDEVSAVIEVPSEGSWIGGLLVEFVDANDYTIVKVNSGNRLDVHHYQNGWKILSSGLATPEPKDGKLPIKAARKEGRLTVWVGEREIITINAKPGPLGLMIQDCTLGFRDITWKETTEEKQDADDTAGKSKSGKRRQ